VRNKPAERDSLDLAEAVNHERDELNAAESRNLILGLEAFEEEGEELSNQTRGRAVVLIILVLLFSLTLLEVCRGV
jgi:hypothetical protein